MNSVRCQNDFTGNRVSIRTLLGQKRQEMTDKYNDDRDQGWTQLVLKK